MDNKNKSNSNSYNPNADAWAKGLGNPNDPSKWSYTSAKDEAEPTDDSKSPDEKPNNKSLYDDLFKVSEQASVRHSEEPLNPDTNENNDNKRETADDLKTEIIGDPITEAPFNQAEGRRDYDKYKPGKYENVRSESIEEHEARQKAEREAAKEKASHNQEAKYKFHVDIDDAMVDRAEKAGNLDDVPTEVKAKYGLLSRQERKAISDDMIASYSFFDNLPSFGDAIKMRDKVSREMLSSERTGGWSDRGREKLRDYKDVLNDLAGEYGKSLSDASKNTDYPLNDRDINLATITFFKQWIKSTELKKVEQANHTLRNRFANFKDRIVESFRSKNKRKIAVEAIAATVGGLLSFSALTGLANSEHYMGNNTHNAPTVTATMPGGDHRAEKHEKSKNSHDTETKVDIKDLNRAEVHYTADNLPKADYHLWGIARGDGTYDVSHKVNSTAFSTPLPNNLEGAKSYYFEGTTSNPQQQAIYSVNLLSDAQLNKLGFTGNRADGAAIDAFAARLSGDNQLRADAMNDLADLMNDGKINIEFAELPAGEYENYGIRQNSDGTKHLVYDTIRVDDGKLSVVKFGDMYVNMACGNVLVRMNVSQAPAPVVQQTETTANSTPTPSPDTTTDITHDTTVDIHHDTPAPNSESTPTPTPDTPAPTPTPEPTPTPDTPTPDTPTPTPEPTPTPDTPKPETKLEPKVISKIQRQNAPSNYMVNHQPGSAENPNGVTEHITHNAVSGEKPSVAPESKPEAPKVKEVHFKDRVFANNMNNLMKNIVAITEAKNVTEAGIQNAKVVQGGPSYEEMKQNSVHATGVDNATGQAVDLANEVN